MEQKGELFCSLCLPLPPLRVASLPSEAMNIAQQVLALDTRYNACRPLPQQYREWLLARPLEWMAGVLVHCSIVYTQ